MSSRTLDRGVAGPAARRTLVAWAQRPAGRGAIGVVAFGALYSVATGVVAARRPLWNDELYTYHFARVPHLADLWRALQTGADQAPPLGYLLTRASLDLFGTSRLSLRLPELVAFFVLCVCMYVFVARRTNELYGLIAMLLPSVTAAYYYASEARAYALVLAFGALALVSWQLATEGARRRLTVPGLFVALFLATSSHYYAVLLLVPLMLGELTRSAFLRKADWQVWLAFSGSLLPFVVFIQLVRASHGFAADFWGRPRWPDVLSFFSFLLDTRSRVAGIELGQIGRPTAWSLGLLAVTVLVAAVVVLSPAAEWLRRRRRARVALFAAIVAGSLLGIAGVEQAARVPISLFGAVVVAATATTIALYLLLRLGARTPLLAGPPAHETVAVTAFLLVPLAGVILAKTVTNAYTHRYSLPAVIGLAVFPLALYRVEGRRTLVGAGAVAALAVTFVAAFVPHEQNASRLSAGDQRTVRFLEEHAGIRAPILIDNPHAFLELSQVAPPPLARRFLYVADPDWDSTQRGLPDLGRIASLRVYERKDTAALPAFLLAFSARSVSTWSDLRYWSALRLLRSEGRTITRRAAFGEKALYTVSASRADRTER
jgi:4-amino-4-deoxy-L-arabinose transferase-like glycosyltransferase